MRLAALTAAETTDLCNATALILTDYGKLLILQAYFIAKQLLERNSRKDKQDYMSMTNLSTENEITSQLVIITTGHGVRKECVTQWFCKLRDEYCVSFLKIGYDRAMAKEWLTNMQEHGFSLEKYYKDDDIVKRDYGLLTDVEQNGRTLSEPIKKIKSLFENGKLVFDRGNKLLPYCFYNLKLHQDARNYLYRTKQSRRDI